MTYYIIYKEKECVKLILHRSSVINIPLSSQMHSPKSFIPKHYRQFQKAWISWAIENDIPCDGLSDLPYVQWYIRWSIVKKRAARSWSSSSKK